METVHTKGSGSQPGHTPKTVLGPLTTRDVLVILGGLLVLVGSMIPIPWSKDVAVSLWIFPGLPFHLFVSVLLPVGVAAGFLWRRLTGRSRVRVGSLSLDQAASVVGIIATAYFFNSYVASMAPAYLLGLLGGLAIMTGTTMANYLGAFRGDFVPGGESVLGSDVHPVPVAHKANADAAAAAPADKAAEAEESEVFGASSSGAYKAAPNPAVPRVDAANAAEPATAKPASVTPAVDEPAVIAAAAAAATGLAPESSSGEVVPPAASTLGVQKSTDHALTAPPRRENQDGASRDASRDAVAEEHDAVVPEKAETPQHESATTPAISQDSSVKSAEPASASAGTSVPQNRTEAPSAAEAQKPAAPTSANLTADSTADSDASDPAEVAPAVAANGVETPQETSAPTKASAESNSDHGDAANPSTMATPMASGDIKATAALSRADILAHQQAVERAKAEAESSFGARAEVQEAEQAPSSFWFALNVPRPVYHPGNGSMLGTLKPGTWFLCLEDRGNEYLIDQPNGTPAVLRNLDDLQFPGK